jgi:hypothetical protein
MGRPHRWSRLSVRNWRVRTKLVAVVLVPVLAFLAVGGFELRSRLRNTAQLGDYADRVTLAGEVSGLVHVVQQERDRTAGVLAQAPAGAGGTGDAHRLAGATEGDRTAVDSAIASYRTEAGSLRARADGPVAAQLRTAERALAELPRLRAAAAGGEVRDDVVFDGYTRLIAALIRIVPDSAGADSAVDRDVRSLYSLMQLKELQSQVRGRLHAVASAGTFGFGEYQALADLRARRSAAAGRFRAESGPVQLVRYDETVKGGPVLTVLRLERAAADRAPGARLGFDAAQWWAASTAQLDLLRKAERRFTAAAVASADALRAAASRRAIEVALVIAGIVLAALAASFGVGRSMAGSLRRLRAQALIVASHRLPDVIRSLSTGDGTEPVLPDEPSGTATGDEIGEVAEAFDAVHRSAVTLAVEQAMLRRNVSAMFVNLARRSQVLVDRQLTVLDELEAQEHDPDRLEKLFALDHLTTRLRRNDENLLVLAAGESQRMWREPVRLSRVLLGALAETEQYQRVQVAGPDDVLVVGHAVPDLMHLLAELVDNATAFSAPGTPVRLTAQLLYGGAGGAVVTVDDDGMGMTPSMLADANSRLARPAPIDVSVSERMGLFVVSHLAARHSIRVELAVVTTGGVTATVTIPSPLLTPVDAAALHAESPRGPEAGAQPVNGLNDQTVTLPVIPGVQRRSAAALARRGFPGRSRRSTDAPAVAPAHAAPDPLSEPSERAAAWWSGGDVAWPGATLLTPSEPVPAGTTAAGLPQRAPRHAAEEPGPRPEPADQSALAALPRREPNGTAPAGAGPIGAGPTGGGPAETAPDGTGPGGLPVRVPGAARAAATPPAPLAAPGPAPPDMPSAVGDMLARFHSGVRRGETGSPD